MNKYRVVVRGTDPIGDNFLKNVVALANKGAIIEPNTVPLVTFPHRAQMLFYTDELKKDNATHSYYLLPQEYELKDLEKLSWEEFKRAMKLEGITGSKRETMQDRYVELLQARKALEAGQVVETDDPPKRGRKPKAVEETE